LSYRDNIKSKQQNLNHFLILICVFDI